MRQMDLLLCRRVYGPALLVVVGAAVMMLLIGNNASALDSSLFIATDALLALALGVSYGQGGILCMAQATFAAVGGYCSAIVASHAHLPAIVGLLIAIAAPAILGLVVATLTVRLSPLALAFATLTLGQIAQVVFEQGGNLTGGFVGLAGISPTWFTWTPFRAQLWTWVAVAIVVLLVSRLKHSVQGTAYRLIQEDRVLAESLGISPIVRLSSLFAFAGGIAGLAGWLYTTSRFFIAPDSLALDLSIDVVIFVVVGGVGYVLGPVVGTAVLVLIRDRLPSAEVEGMFYGGVLVLALIFAPQGILHELSTLAERLRAAVPGRQPSSPPAGTGELSQSRSEASKAVPR